MSLRKVHPTKMSNTLKFRDKAHQKDTMIRYGRMMLDGVPYQTIDSLIRKEFGIKQDDVTKKTGVYKFINQIKDNIAEAVVENNEEILKIHTLLYEDIYHRFRILEHEDGQLRALEQKEKLLGMIDKDVQELVINNQVNVIENSNEFDMSRLSKQEADRMQQLIEKAKK